MGSVFTRMGVQLKGEGNAGQDGQEKNCPQASGHTDLSPDLCDIMVPLPSSNWMHSYLDFNFVKLNDTMKKVKGVNRI